MTDLTVAPTEQIQNEAAIKEEEEENGGYFVQIGGTDPCAEEKERDEKDEKKLKDQDATVLPAFQASIQSVGTGLFAEQKVNDENVLIQVSAADPTAKPKEDKKKKRKGKEEDEQKYSKEQKEVAEGKKRKGQIKSLKGHVKGVYTRFNGSVDDGDRAELDGISALLDAVDEDAWDNATNVYYLKIIELVRMRVKKKFDNKNMREKLILNLETNLDNEADRRLSQAKVVQNLVNELKVNLSKLDYQRTQVPCSEINRKMEMGEIQVSSLEEMAKQLPYIVQDFDELVRTGNEWNQELLKDTFWDHSPDKMEKSKIGSKPALEYAFVKVERFIFNPERTRYIHFIEVLRDRACDHPQFGKLTSEEGQFETVRQCSLLQYQTTPKKQPPRWFIIELQYLKAEADLYIRSDNLYIGGFGNKIKQIYELGNSDNPPLLKGSVPFECDCDYISLMNYEREEKPPKDREVERLKKLVLNMWALAKDITALSEYDHRIKKNDGEWENVHDKKKWEKMVKRAQKAVGRTAVVFPEVCRFLVLFHLVEEGWLTKLGSFLTDLMIAYMRHWKIMSDRLRNDEEDKKFTPAEKRAIKMTYAFEAFRVLCLVLNTKGGGIEKSNEAKGDGPEGGNDSQGAGGNDKVEKNNEEKGDGTGKGGNDSQGAGGNDKVPKKDEQKEEERPSPGNEGVHDHTLGWAVGPEIPGPGDARPRPGNEGALDHTLACAAWPEIPGPVPKTVGLMAGPSRVVQMSEIGRQPAPQPAGATCFRPFRLGWAMPGLSFQGSRFLWPVPKRSLAQSIPKPEPKKKGGSDSQGAGNDKEEEGGKSRLNNILSIQGVSVCDSPLPLPTGSTESSTNFSSAEGSLHELLKHYENMDVTNADLLTTASSMKFNLCGQPLLEVFSIHTNSAFIKTIAIYDDRAGKFVYRSRDVDTVNFFQHRDLWLSSHPKMDSGDYMEELVLSGPSRAMSALPGFLIEADVDDDNGVFDLAWSWRNRTVVDKQMMHSIFTSRGEVHVTSAVMSNAVQAQVEILLFLPYRTYSKCKDGGNIRPIVGRLELQLDGFSAGILMFQSPAEYGSHFGPTYLEKTAEACERGVVGKVRLNRKIFALPVGSGFRIKGELFFSDNSMLIDHSIEWKDLLGGLCKFPVLGYDRALRDRYPGYVSHGAVRVNMTCPF